MVANISTSTCLEKDSKRAFDLKAIFDEVNTQYFAGKASELTIDWGRSSVKSARYKRRLGSFNFKTKSIRISPILDDREIPDYFISFIIYHEILHYFFPPRRSFFGKRKIHHKDFKAKERTFEKYRQVKAWEKEIGRKKFFKG